MDEKPAVGAKGETAPRTDERAFEEHVCEMTEYAEESEEPPALPPVRFVRWLLDRWGVEASAIPEGGLLDHLRKHGVGEASQKRAA